MCSTGTSIEVDLTRADIAIAGAASWQMLRTRYRYINTLPRSTIPRNLCQESDHHLQRNWTGDDQGAVPV